MFNKKDKKEEKRALISSDKTCYKKGLVFNRNYKLSGQDIEFLLGHAYNRGQLDCLANRYSAPVFYLDRDRYMSKVANDYNYFNLDLGIGPETREMYWDSQKGKFRYKKDSRSKNVISYSSKSLPKALKDCRNQGSHDDMCTKKEKGSYKSVNNNRERGYQPVDKNDPSLDGFDF